jgi:hypothetical protein
MEIKVKNVIERISSLSGTKFLTGTLEYMGEIYQNIIIPEEKSAIKCAELIVTKGIVIINQNIYLQPSLIAVGEECDNLTFVNYRNLLKVLNISLDEIEKVKFLKSLYGNFKVLLTDEEIKFHVIELEKALKNSEKWSKVLDINSIKIEL